MSTHTDTIDALHNPAKPGPKTPEGKATSSRNALKEGLFATHDFIRLGERDEYDALAAAFHCQLDPDGPLEELFTTEIIGANWRLRRCRLVEEDLSAKYDQIDPMQDDEGAKVQRSVDRARANALNVIRRAMAEMRKLQTERHIRTELGASENYGISEFTKIVRVLTKYGSLPKPEAPDNNDDDVDRKLTNLQAEPDSFCNTAPTEPAQPPAPHADSFCKADPRTASSQKIGRNEPDASPLWEAQPCPCGSGLKYKKCCDSPEVHNQKHAA